MKILVPVDGSKHAMEGLNIALDYAKTKHAEIWILNVIPNVEGMDLEISPPGKEKIKRSMEQKADAIVRQALGLFAGKGLKAQGQTMDTSVSVPDAIIEFAEKQEIDLIIIGSRGLDPSSRFRMGSVASRVVRHSPCSVYVVKMKTES